MIPVPPNNKMVIKVSSPFPYEGDKVLPVKYNPILYINGQTQDNKPLLIKETAITNITCTICMTRNGRVFESTLVQQKHNEALDNAKGKEVAETDQWQISTKIIVSDKDAEEFLRLIKKSRHRVVDQLNQTLSKMSVISLLLRSETHRESLMKILSVAHVTNDIIVDQFNGVVANLTSEACIGFRYDELPSQGRAHNKALHISIKCMNTHLSIVLIDNGSSQNVMPTTTLMKQTIEGVLQRSTSMIVRAFDGSQIS